MLWGMTVNDTTEGGRMRRLGLHNNRWFWDSQIWWFDHVTRYKSRGSKINVQCQRHKTTPRLLFATKAPLLDNSRWNQLERRCQCTSYVAHTEREIYMTDFDQNYWT